MNSVAAGILAGLLVCPAFAQPPSGKGVNFYSLAREAQLGQKAAATLARTLPIVREPKLDAYFARLTGELAKYAGQPFAYSFTVYEDRKPIGLQWVRMAMPVDAFESQAGEPVALPGGPILIPLSLLAAATDEAELAFQLAHAMAHVSLRHSTRNATRADIMDLAAVPLVVTVRNDPGPAGSALLTAQEIALQSALLTFARTFELEADSVAAGIVAAAGYDPEAMIPYLEGQPPARNSQVFSAHPAVGRRVAAVRAAIEKLPPRAYAAGTGEFDEVKALAAGVR